MTVLDLAGQHVLVDFAAPEITPEVERIVREGRVGGVILFAKNIRSAAQVRELTSDLQRLAARSGLPPLFITVDQEGGRVNRLTDGVTVFPGAMALGASGRAADAAAAGRMTALELRALGINVNHAPVLDVNSDPANPVIGMRSFGDDPDAVGRLGTAYLEATQGAGVLSTPKHFPGHGATVVDSHLDLPEVRKDRKRLRREEIAPFAAALAAGADALLTAHVVYPALDADVPATLSPTILTTLLRGDLGFEGLVFTDSMEMKAISARWGRGEAAVRALSAGADVIMACGPAAAQWETLDALRRAAEDGILDAAALRRSAARIARIKGRYAASAPAPVPERPARGVEMQPPAALGGAARDGPAPPPPAFDRSAHEAAAQEIANRAVTLVRDAAAAVPLRGSRIAVLQVGGDAWATPAVHFAEALAALGLGVTVTRSVPEVGGRVWDAVVAVSLSWRSSEGAATIATLHDEFGSRLVVVGAGDPYELTRFPQVPAYLAAYGPDPASMRAAARILAGRIPPRGRLPVDLPPLYRRGHAA